MPGASCTVDDVLDQIIAVGTAAHLDHGCVIVWVEADVVLEEGARDEQRSVLPIRNLAAQSTWRWLGVKAVTIGRQWFTLGSIGLWPLRNTHYRLRTGQRPLLPEPK